MVPTLVFSLLVADPAARLDAFLKARPTFAAVYEVTGNGAVIGTGTLRVQRPRRLRFDAKGPGLDFTMSSVEASYIEVDRTEKVYDERPSTGGFRFYDSRISGAPALMPTFLLGGTAAAAMGTAKPTATSVAGGDELRATFTVEGGELEKRLTIDPQGRPIRFSERSPVGLRVWRLVSFAATAGEFAVAAPLGYVPFALPELPTPLEIGQTAPLKGWRRAGKPFDLAEPQRGKPRLLAVLGTDCPASRAVRPSLANLGRTMPVLVIAKGEIEDPSGLLLKRLSPPGTPMFYLVGADGMVKTLWFGFDKAKAAAWEAEVKAAAAK